MGAQFTKRLFTVKEYYQMADAGILTESDRVELLQGEIVQMTPIGSRHAACVDRLNQLLVEGVARRAIVRVQNPIHLGDFSEPQPDLALVEQHVDYAQDHPMPEDVLLVIEVADTSVATDQDVKIPLYARADIPEAWLIDLPAHRVIVYRQPSPQGYQETIRLGRGDSVVVPAFADMSLLVDDILGPM